MRRNDSYSRRNLLIESLNFDQSTGLFAGLIGMTFANWAPRAAAHPTCFRRSGCAHGLRGIYPQREHGHQYLNEALHVFRAIEAVTVPQNSKQNHLPGTTGRWSLGLDIRLVG